MSELLLVVVAMLLLLSFMLEMVSRLLEGSREPEETGQIFRLLSFI